MSVRILILFLLLATSCSDESEIRPSAAHRTVLVYLAGDNNLSEEVWQKIDSLTAGWHNGEDHLLIYEDTHGERGTPSLLRVRGDAAEPFTEVVREYPESNSASADVFAGVVEDATTLFPASSYGLLFFSHATGWLPEGGYVKPRSAGQSLRSVDASLRSIGNDSDREMELVDFAAAIPDGCFDFIVFEACLMSGVEVAYELRDKADYLVASSAEILSPGFTAIYPALINDLFTRPEADLTGFARRYYEHCQSLDGAYRSATISVIRLDRMDALAEAMRPVYATLPSLSMDINDIQCFDRSARKLFFDVSDFVNHVSVPETDLTGPLREAVVFQASTPDFVNIPVRSHSGLTVYIEQADYPLLNAWWRKTSWYKATHR